MDDEISMNLFIEKQQLHINCLYDPVSKKLN